MIPFQSRSLSNAIVSGMMRFAFVTLLLALLPSVNHANTFVAYGPVTYTRTTGAPTPVTANFTVLDPNTTYTLRIDSTGVSSAVVTLNGVDVLRPNDFNANVTLITKQVMLWPNNQLTVELRGKPGEGFKLQIIGVDDTPPTITGAVAPAPNAAGWNKSDPTVTFTCSDATSGIASCTEPVTVTAETSAQVILGTATDKAGNTATAPVTVKLDKTPPTLSITSPANGANLFLSTVTFSGSAADTLSGLANIICNGAPGTVNGNSFSCNVTLTPGANSINVIATDVAGNTSASSRTLTYTRVPTIRITSPTNLSYLNVSPTTVTGTVDDDTATVTINSVQAAVVNGTFSAALPLAEGPNTITASAASTNGAVGTASVEVTLDTTPPHVTITTPVNLSLIHI